MRQGSFAFFFFSSSLLAIGRGRSELCDHTHSGTRVMGGTRTHASQP
jgi:hypothetical protein